MTEASASLTDAALDAALARSFGLAEFRPWQRDAVRAVLAPPHRALVIAPTGGGKSLCYQFPATQLPGVTIVVSPLIALMEDQVRSLATRGIAATYLASTLDAEERKKRERDVFDRKVKLVYLAPERLGSQWLLDKLRGLSPSLIAIDEAHCISQWGHDFRPEYGALGEVLEAIAPPRVLACTATATPRVRDEILERLRLAPDETTLVMRGFARPNLHLTAIEVDSAATRKKVLLSSLREAMGDPRKPQGAAIVYAATRRNTEDVTAVIRGAGFSARAYHAGLPAEERQDVSEAFASRSLDVVVATNAFGMGIDRPDIRVVVHVQTPGSIEAYYQEVGRAGRDGQPARGILLSATADIGLRRRLLELDRGEEGKARFEREWGLFLELLRYVDAGSCRHDFMLRYFGDEEELLGGCGHCDVCEALEDAVETSAEDVELTVKKALAGVARADRRSGLHAVADMLRGDANAKVKKLGFDRLSTFGLFRAETSAWVLSLLRRLIAAGLVDVTGGDYPMLGLTRQGVKVMKGDDKARVLLPLRVRVRSAAEKRASRVELKPVLHGAETSLYEVLKRTRTELAKEAGVPPYVVCHDKTLLDIVKKLPRNKTELRGVFGMGPARIDAYGHRLLGVVNEHA